MVEVVKVGENIWRGKKVDTAVSFNILGTRLQSSQKAESQSTATPKSGSAISEAWWLIVKERMVERRGSGKKRRWWTKREGDGGEKGAVGME